MGITKVGEAEGTNVTTLNLPAGLLEDDIVVVLAGRTSGGRPSLPTGWTGLGADNSSFAGQAYYKKMGATPDTSITWTNAAAIVCQAFRGVDPTTPLDVAVVQTYGFTGLPDGGSATSVTDNALSLLLGGLDDDQSDGLITAPTGYSNLIDADQASSPNTVMMASKLVPTAGAVDPAAFTGTGTDAWDCWHLMLRPYVHPTPVAPSLGSAGSNVPCTVQTVDYTWVGDGSTVANSLTSGGGDFTQLVDADQTVIQVTAQGGSTSDYETVFTAEIVSATEIELTVSDNPPDLTEDIEIHLEIMEFSGSVEVQQGITAGEKNTNITITAVDLDSSMVFAQAREVVGASGNTSSDVMPELTTTTNLYIAGGGGNANTVKMWAVVDFGSANVYSNERLEFSRTAAETVTTTHNLSTDISLANSIVQWWSNGAGSNDWADKTGFAELLDVSGACNQFEFTRATTQLGNPDYAVHVMCFNNVAGVSAQRGDLALDGSTDDITITEVDLTRSTALLAATWPLSADGDGVDEEALYVTPELTTSTNLRLTRAGTDVGYPEYSWQVVQWALAGNNFIPILMYY